jgi:hypothetical protein
LPVRGRRGACPPGAHRKTPLYPGSRAFDGIPVPWCPGRPRAWRGVPAVKRCKPLTGRKGLHIILPYNC